MIEYKLMLAGCECSVAEWNPGGRNLVFGFHGWLDNLASFESMAAIMSDVRLIAIDFPGHGHSDHLAADKSYHFIDGLYLIDDLLTHFQLASANLLGHSMGGAIATLYAAAQPNRVDQLILIEALGPLTTAISEIQSGLAQSLEQRRALKNKKKPVYDNFQLALNARAEASQIKAEFIKPVVERALTSVDDGYTWRSDSRLRVASPIRLSEEQLRSLLPSINAPCLLIEAESGLLRSPNADYIQQRKPLIKQLEPHLLAGSHHLHLENPGKVGQLIQDFLK